MQASKGKRYTFYSKAVLTESILLLTGVEFVLRPSDRKADWWLISVVEGHHTIWHAGSHPSAQVVYWVYRGPGMLTAKPYTLEGVQYWQDGGGSTQAFSSFWGHHFVVQGHHEAWHTHNNPAGMFLVKWFLGYTGGLDFWQGNLVGRSSEVISSYLDTRLQSWEDFPNFFDDWSCGISNGKRVLQGHSTHLHCVESVKISQNDR